MTEAIPDAPADQPNADTAPVDDTLAKATADVEKWKALARKHEAEAKAGKDAAKRLADIESASQSDLEKAVAAARTEGATQALQGANARLIAAEARALAAESKFRNPATAVRLLDLSDVSVTDDGQVDTEALKSRLEALAKDEPYLVADGAVVVPPPGQAGIGVSGSSTPTDGSARSLIAAGLAATTKS